MVIDIKEKLFEIVVNSIDAEKLLEKLNANIRNIAATALYNDDVSSEDRKNKLFFKLTGCFYDSYIDNLENFKEILDDEENGTIINELVAILKSHYDVVNWEIFESFDKVDLTFEEAVKEILPLAEISSYNKFYPLEGRFESLRSSDETMYIIETNILATMVAVYKTAKLTVTSDSEGNISFIHPMTGQECQELSQCFVGWSEMNEEYTEDWKKLLEELKNDNILDQRIWDFDNNEYDYSK